jgi:hypothetical protein
MRLHKVRLGILEPGILEPGILGPGILGVEEIRVAKVRVEDQTFGKAAVQKPTPIMTWTVMCSLSNSLHWE